MFGNELCLKYGRFLILGECDKEDYNGVVEKSYQCKSLLKRRRYSEFFYFVYVEVQFNFIGSFVDFFGLSLLLENYNMRNFCKKDIIVVKVFFFDFFF